MSEHLIHNFQPSKTYGDSPAFHGKWTDPRTGITYDFDAAQANFKAGLQKSNLLRKQAIAFLMKKQPDKAVPLLKQSLQLMPIDGSSRCYLADIYIAQNRPNDALEIMQPLVYPPDTPPSGAGMELVWEMKYVLALLDVGKWEEAVSTYEMNMRLQEKNKNKGLLWQVVCYDRDSGGKTHTLANVHFSSDLLDEPGLRRQAHLVLGTRGTDCLPELVAGTMEEERKADLLYMLGHLQQALQSDRRCLDAQFLSGVILSELDRFAEGRQAFAKATLLAPREAQPEIKDALAKIKAYEESKKLYESQQAEALQTRTNK